MKFLTVIFRVLNVLVCIVIAICLLLALPIPFGNRPVVVLSGSMKPAYPVGSIIYYKHAEFDNINVGDPITFDIGSSNFATHRVIEKNEEDQTFTTKGDNNPTADQNPVEYGRIVGKATDFAIPYAGFFISKVQNVPAFVIMMAILIVNSFLGKDVKTKKDKEALAHN